jgi:GTPase Era involved in 16S rRNA processing
MDETARLSHIESLVERFQLATLKPSLAACEALARQADVPLDVAVFGQFKSGKSSLVNAVLGSDVLPVGVVPVTTVVTRVSGGSRLAARVTLLDGSVQEVEPASIADFVAESRNPENRRQVAVVDIFTPALADLPGLRLVDTPGLGSVLVHNTQATRDWLPNVAIALVAVSADRPLAEEDRRLISELRPHAPRIAVVVTKVDLLTEDERQEVKTFLSGQLERDGKSDVPVLLFSTHEQSEKWAGRLKDELLRPFAANAQSERARTLVHKLDSLTTSCREYLTVALHVAEQAEAERQQLAATVLDESIRESVIRDELALASQRLTGSCRPAFEKGLLPRSKELARRLSSALGAEMPNWHGNLSQQKTRYEDWMRQHLHDELQPASREAGPIAAELVAQAEVRFRRVCEAFRDRLSRNVSRSVGVTLSPVTWEEKRPALAAPPVAVGQTFMTQWDLLWWLLPMRIVGGLFRRHCAGRLSWELQKNLMRLVSDWSGVTGDAIMDLRDQAAAWVYEELTTLTRLLAQRPEQVAEIQVALAKLNAPPST